MEYVIPPVKGVYLTKENYYRAVLGIFNYFSGLTSFEMDIIVTMLVNNQLTIDRPTRKLLRDKLNKDKFNLNNYIKRLKIKNVLIDVEDKTVLNPSILEAIKDKEINIKFNVNPNS